MTIFKPLCWDPNNNMDTSYEAKKYRRWIQLALAAGATKGLTACPSDEELSTYIDDLVNQKTRASIAAHLNQCPDCRQQWLEASEVTRSLRQEAARKSAKKPYAVPCQTSNAGYGN